MQATNGSNGSYYEGSFPPGLPIQGRGAPNEHAQELIIHQLTWLNRNVCPDKPLDYDRVAHGLLQLSADDAMGILRQFEEIAPEVRDPIAWVNANSRKALSPSFVDGLAVLPRSGRNAGVERRGRGAKRNRSGNIVAGNPAEEAVRAALGAGVHQLHANGNGDGKISFYGDFGDVGGRLRKRIDWLNNSGQLAEPLDPDRLSAEMADADPGSCFEILKELEVNSSEIRNPTAFVLSNLRRVNGAKVRRKARRRGGNRGNRERY